MTLIRSKDEATLLTRAWRWKDARIGGIPNYELKNKIKAWSFAWEDMLDILKQPELLSYLRLYLAEDNNRTSMIALGVKTIINNNVYIDEDFVDGKIYKADLICDDLSPQPPKPSPCDHKSFLYGDKNDKELSWAGEKIKIRFTNPADPGANPVSLEKAKNWTRHHRDKLLDDENNSRKSKPLNEHKKEIQAWSFGISTIRRLLKSWKQELDKVAFFKFYLALNPEKRNDPTTLIMLLADKDNNDIVTGGRYQAIIARPADGPEMFEFADPCPSFCNGGGILYND